nr:hypothetical protein [Candidatus Sigynarchaeum springense]
MERSKGAIVAGLLLDDSLFGVASATEPRVIEAAIGVAAGIVGCLGISFIVANYPRLSCMLKIIAVIMLVALTVASKLASIPFFILVRFGILLISALLAWVDAARARRYEEPTDAEGRFSGSNLRVAFVLVALLAGGGLWQQRENLYIWSPMLEAMLCAITGSVAAAASMVLFSIESRTMNREAAIAVPASMARADRSLGTSLLLSLFFGISCGVYLSLSMLVAQNTAIEYPSRVAYAINAGIAVAVVAVTLAIACKTRVVEQEQVPRGLLEGPIGLAFLLVVALITVGLPYMLATLDLVDFTTAGTLHVTGMVAVPLLGFFMLSRLARTNITGGYAALVGSFGGVGLVVGIAGYLVGGNTYNMDFYIGLAFTILLALGVITAWLYKPRSRGQESVVFSGASKCNPEVPR